VAVDDIDRDLDVDLLVEVPGGAGSSSRARRVLGGFEYALLDPALAGRPSRTVDDRVDTVLVATGGTDADGVGATIARALRDARRDTRARLVVGPWSSPEVPDGVDAVRSDCGLAADLAAADVVVTAAGVTMLESLALGRPTVAFVVADNQRRTFDGVVAAGAALGSTRATAAADAVALFGDPERRRVLSRSARAVVDGRGAARVAEAVVALG
jgi:spore coat polysaccharide biosynthesis predicted glycosyltransferase SpsG